MKIITGASRGIGKYLLERYVDEDEFVQGTFLDTQPTPLFLKHYSSVDVSNFTSVCTWIDGILSKGQDENYHLKIELINCAGINYNSFAHRARTYYWGRVIKVNLIGTFNVICALLPHMRRYKYGRIINLSSVVDKLGIAGTSAYAASKAGLEGMTKVLATENASKGITVNNLRLGYFGIGMGKEVPTEVGDKILDRIPAHEFGRPDHIYDAVEFLIKNDYINGTSLDLNGGLV